MIGIWVFHLLVCIFIYFNHSGAFNEKLKLFKGAPKSATSFRSTFENIFLVKLSHPEIGSLMKTMDPELAANHMIDGNKFLLGFFKLARIQEKVLLGLLDESSVNIVVFQSEKCGSTVGGSNNLILENEEKSFLRRPSEFAAVEPKSMLSTLLGVNPYTDWDIGKQPYLGNLSPGSPGKQAELSVTARKSKTLGNVRASVSAGGCRGTSPNPPRSAASRPHTSASSRSMLFGDLLHCPLEAVLSPDRLPAIRNLQAPIPM